MRSLIFVFNVFFISLFSEALLVDKESLDGSERCQESYCDKEPCQERLEGEKGDIDSCDEKDDGYGDISPSLEENGECGKEYERENPCLEEKCIEDDLHFPKKDDGCLEENEECGKEYERENPCLEEKCIEDDVDSPKDEKIERSENPSSEKGEEGPSREEREDMFLPLKGDECMEECEEDGKGPCREECREDDVTDISKEEDSSEKMPDYRDFVEREPYSFHIDSIVVTGKGDILETRDFSDQKGVVFIDITPPKKEVLRSKLEDYINDDSITKEEIMSIKREIIIHYRECGRPIVDVWVPKQSISDGSLKFIVIEARLGKITVIGDRYFKKYQYIDKIRAEPGQFIDEKMLLRDIDFLNRNPFRRVSMIYTSGEVDKTTDIELLVSENRPIMVYYGADNTGLDLIGKDRFFAGFHFGNLFRKGHIFSYQLTKSYDSHIFEANTFQYTLPLPWKHLLFMYGGYAKVHAELPVFITSNTDGKSAQGSFRYIMPISVSKGFVHDLIVGFDFKRTNNSIEFTTFFPVIAQSVNLTQILFAYNLKYANSLFKTSLDMDIYYSPGRWIPDQRRSAYQAIRLYANNAYVYGLLKWQSLVNIYKELSLSFMFKGQAASTNLLPSEQFGIGGYNSVRGYDERELNGDHGVLFSCECRLPTFSIFKYLFKKIDDSFQILGFFDYGKIWIYKKIKNQPRSNYALGIGPGFRYVIDPVLTFRMDWGYRLHRLSDKHRGPKVHFGAIFSY